MGNIYSEVKNLIYAPVNGGSADIALGAWVRKGATPASHNGMLIVGSGTSAIANCLGRMMEPLDYSVEGETVIAGTSFVRKPIEVAHPFKVHRMEYDQTSVITCTQAVSTTTMTVTSLEDNIDACFVYVVGGTGAGQTNYATASASGALTLKAAFGTDLSTDSTFLKILPRFHELLGFTADGTSLTSQAAAGGVTGFVVETWMQRNSRMEILSPVDHAALTGLNGLDTVKFFADIALIDAIPYSIA